MQLARIGVILALLGGTFTAIQEHTAEAVADATVYATAQRFERGLMIWRADTGLIWVLTYTGEAYAYPASTYGTLPDNPYFPEQPGHFRPINGFGRVWGNFSTVRAALGWATMPELGFSMRVIDLLHTQYLVQMDGSIIAITGSTWRYAESLPSEVNPSARIDQLTITPNPVAPGGTVQINWSASGGQMVLIEVRDPRAGNAYLVEFLEHLPLTGSTTLAIPAHLAQGAEITLWVANRVTAPSGVVMYERLVKQVTQVQVQAATSNTSYTYAAYQPYANGFMIWRADTGSVTVFGGRDGGPRVTYPESKYGPLPDNPFFDVPAGYTRPINGFGRVWGNFEQVRQMLGWALGPEQAYTLTVTVDGSGNIQSYLLPDGRVVDFHWQYWRFED